ncbi:ABC-2 family transporter protein [Paenibacillus sp. TRM 82003]|uniref:ABC transporter permease n=1 Tax=Kineococcus sp. TRM81007 TaxID=2925831 RepID=UPI001F575567|nr:ABC-2 family transporter protein [Kineococcus sp. TRM81007]MCI2237148.1 ABC-2 family transporter protein [Kineococcus sp. TRM81007]MCI3925269.1 ABC-2 family transporter protein [Paenibacillus sp. TRM 82003]
MPVTAYPALAAAGFRRYSAYRAATAAGALANTVFGAVKAAVLTGTVVAAGGSVAGYGVAQAATFAWLSQALLAPVSVFADDRLARRVRTGDVAVDLARPVDPQLAAWADDLGRAAFQLLPRGLPPLLVGALTTGLVLPPEPAGYLLGCASLVLGVSVSFALRWAVNLTAFWLIDVRGVLLLYTVCATVLTGLAVPVAWFPPWLAALAAATPFPSVLQAPADVFTGVVTGAAALRVVAVQTAWLVVVLAAGRLLLAAGSRRLVVQGG